MKTAASSAAVVCASDFCAEQFGEPFDRLYRVPLGVDLDTFHPRRAPDVRTLGPEPIPLAFVGRLSPEKRPALAIEAVRELVSRGVDVKLRVVGDGPLRGQLEALAMGLPVMFVGHLENRAWVATILAGARAIIAPCGTETFGLAVLEAMACGTPAIALDNTAFPEFAGGVAWLLPDAGVETLKAAMAALLADTGARRRMAVDGPRRAAAYEWSLITRRYLDLMIEAADRS